MSPKFQVYKDTAGKTRFRLRADNGKIVAVGEAYEQYASCINGIRSIRKNSGSPIEDLTVEGGPRFPNPKYQIFKDAAGKYRFHLKAGNGEIIAQGEGYESKEACLNGIDVVKNSTNAEVEDPFAIKKPAPEPEAAAKIEPQSLMIEPETPLVEAKPEVPTPTEAKIETKIEEMPKPEPPKIETVPFPESKPEIQMPAAPSTPTQAIPIAAAPVTPTSPAEPKMVEEVGPVETKLDLFQVPGDIPRGTHVTFKGRLYGGKSGRGISGAKIHIWERDKSILGDDYLTYGITGDDGSFNIDWHARSLTWRKNTGDIYAKFNGNEKAKAAKSAVQTLTLG